MEVEKTVKMSPPPQCSFNDRPPLTYHPNPVPLMACQEGVDTLQLEFVSAEEMVPNLSQERQSIPPKPTVAFTSHTAPEAEAGLIWDPSENSSAMRYQKMQKYLKKQVFQQSLCTGFAFRIEHRKWNRGRNRLPKLVQTIVPSVPFPMFNPEGEPGSRLTDHN